MGVLKGGCGFEPSLWEHVTSFQDGACDLALLGVCA